MPKRSVPFGVEIDLHGLTVAEAMERVRREYNRHLKAGRISALVFVHGYGSSGFGGKIRIKLRQYLQSQQKKLEIIEGEKVGNPGMTIIYPRKKLPQLDDPLELEILDYCATPRSLKKIAGKFRKYGDVQVMDMLRSLERRELLGVQQRGKHKILYTRSPA